MPDDMMPLPEKRKAATPKQIAEVLIRQNGRCPMCNCKLGGGTPYHIDHIQPLDLLGKNEPDNYQALCEPCHKVKTKDDIAKIAKGRRIRGETGNGPKRQIAGRSSFGVGQKFPTAPANYKHSWGKRKVRT